MKNEYFTPKEYIEKVRIVLGEIHLDPFSCEYANDNFVRAKWFYTKENSCLNSIWANPITVYANPPYSNGEYKPAIEKFLEQFKMWGFDAITLTNNNTDTITTQKLMSKASAYCFPEKRINYYSLEGKSTGNRYGQLFCYFGDNIKLFRETFEVLGRISYNPDYLEKLF